MREIRCHVRDKSAPNPSERASTNPQAALWAKRTIHARSPATAAQISARGTAAVGRRTSAESSFPTARGSTGVCFLLAYEGGEVVPGDDMAGSEARKVSLDELESGGVEILIPSTYSWLPRHAIDMYRQLKDRSAVELQAGL